MRVNFRISNAFKVLLVPFVDYFNPWECLIEIEEVGFEQNVVHVGFFDQNQKKIEIPESLEIQKLVDLWGYTCFHDLIEDLFVQHIVENMQEFNIKSLNIQLNRK